MEIYSRILNYVLSEQVESASESVKRQKFLSKFLLTRREFLFKNYVWLVTKNVDPHNNEDISSYSEISYQKFKMKFPTHMFWRPH